LFFSGLDFFTVFIFLCISHADGKESGLKVLHGGFEVSDESERGLGVNVLGESWIELAFDSLIFSDWLLIHPHILSLSHYHYDSVIVELRSSSPAHHLLDLHSRVFLVACPSPSVAKSRFDNDQPGWQVDSLGKSRRGAENPDFPLYEKELDDLAVRPRQ
jgi:hypothetical protein